MPTRAFPLGNLYATPGALGTLSHEDLLATLGRHAAGDWGDVGADDWQANERALLEGSRIFSVYHSSQGVKFWVITEADRSSTAVLLPEEY